MNLDCVSFTVTAPGAAGAAAAAVAGDAAAVRNGRADSRIQLLGSWTKAQAVGFSQLVYPSGHDQVRNYRWRNVANNPVNTMPWSVPQQMRPQDPLSVVQAGSAVAGDVELVTAMLWYEDLPGIQGRLIGPDELNARGVETVTVEDTTTATVASQYSGARALNAASDLLKANTDYALLGAVIGAPCAALTVRGVDSGNLRCAIPGNNVVLSDTVNWFVSLSSWWGLPAIPVWNSANKAGIFIENLQDENLTAVPFSLLLCQLAPQ